MWDVYVSDTEITTDQVPNPSKVIIILEELSLPYERSWVTLEDLKLKPFTNVNPNGRVPAIEDPNTGITLWESGAIVQVSSTADRHVLNLTVFDYYLVLDRHLRQGQQDLVQQLPREAPDVAVGLFPGFRPRPLLWPSRLVTSPPHRSTRRLMFGRFNFFHESAYGESPESAKLRYGREIKRVAGVLNGVLAKSEWLVGDKCTYADLAFTAWNSQLPLVMSNRKGKEDEWKPDEFKHFTRWQNACMSRDSVKKALQHQAERGTEQDEKDVKVATE